MTPVLQMHNIFEMYGFHSKVVFSSRLVCLYLTTAKKLAFQKICPFCVIYLYSTARTFKPCCVQILVCFEGRQWWIRKKVWHLVVCVNLKPFPDLVAKLATEGEILQGHGTFSRLGPILEGNLSKLDRPAANAVFVHCNETRQLFLQK